MISISYCRITLRDICIKLGLDSEQQAESIVAKAIHDGVIDAHIDHKQGWLISQELPDIYGTKEPEKAFNQRTQFCLNLHDEAVKAMRYPGTKSEAMKELEGLEEREREWATAFDDARMDDEDPGF